MRNRVMVAFCSLLFVLIASQVSAAQERLCDPAYEDCRQPILNLINAETVGIDIAFWYMEDKRYSDAIISRFKADVPVRVLMDPRSSDDGKHPANLQILNDLAAAGIPMRKKDGGGIFHWKMMLFAGQNVVQFSAANYNPNSFVATTPYANYIDEAIYFSDDSSVVNTFKTKFDDRWLDTARFADYANITAPLNRHYPVHAQDPELNFPPHESYVNRAVNHYRQENQKIDVHMFRLRDTRHTDEIIDAMVRNVPVRLLADPAEYRSSSKPETAYDIDRMFSAGAQIRMDNHEGDMHQKSVILYGQGMIIWGSSNWTTASTSSQEEHNYFTTKPWFFQWFVDQFEWKWNHSTAFRDFVPLPPDVPSYISPSDTALGQDTSVTLTWQGGPFAHKYDIYFGTDPNPPLIATDVVVGSFLGSTQERFTVSDLAEGTIYYWRIVSKTMAEQAASGAVWSFITGSSEPPPPAPTGLTANALSDYQIELAWNDVGGELGYKVERSPNGSSGWIELGTTATDATSFLDTNSGLERGKTYYYRVRSYNASGHSPYSNTANATTTETQLSSGDTVLYASEAPVKSGGWKVISDSSAAGGSLISHPNANAATVSTPLRDPTHYFEMRFNAEAGRAYRLWIRGKAERNAVANDSVHVQFSASVDSAGHPVYRIGTTSATTVTIEGCTACGLSGWGWEDNGMNGLGDLIFFETTGEQTIRIQTREDGLSIDQIVISPNTYLTGAPGALKNDAVILPRTNGIQPPPNQPPQVSITAAPGSGPAPLTVNFTSSASDPDGSIVAYNWDFGDGETATEQSPSHVFEAGGTYVARVSVTDNQGATSGASTVITVMATVGSGTVVLYASEAPVRVGDWNVVADSTAAGGSRLANPNMGVPKLSTALANPTHYFEMNFNAEAGTGYRLWMRGKAHNDNFNNDSVFVQFSSSVTASGAAEYRIGTTSATVVALEGCNGCGLSGWGWEDNGWNGLGPLIHFETTGSQTIRVQVREDGMSIDQIVLSSDTFLDTAPGLQKNDATILDRSGGSGSPVSVTAISPNSGSTDGGTSVMISGSGFASGATVAFGGTPASDVVVMSSTSINATTPAHSAGTVDVVVANSDGESGLLIGGYTYVVPAPPPDVAGITPNSGSTDGETFVTISGTGFQSGASVMFGAFPASSVSVEDGTTITATTPAHPQGTADVTITNPDNQSDVLEGGFTFVAPAPAPVVTSVSPNSGGIEGGTSVTITGESFSTGATVEFGGAPATNVVVVGSTSISATTPSHSAGSVDVVVTNPDSQSGTLTDAFTYTGSSDNLPPQGSISASPTSGIAPLTVSFTATASDPDGQVVSYSWDFGDGGTSTDVNPSHVYSSTGTYTVILVVTDDDGATGTATAEIKVPITASDIVLYASEAQVVSGNWSAVTDATAAGGARLANPNAGAAKLSAPLASPNDYFELSFHAESGRGYRLWLRGKAQNDHFNNDSVFVQFSGSVTSTGSPVFRIGTTSATTVALEACTGCGLSGWGWEDNGWNGLGDLIHFDATGTQTLRVQVREDGLSIDQIVLSPETFLSTAPGPQKNDSTILPKNNQTSQDPGGSEPVTVVRQPYLQKLTASAATIVWASHEAGPAEVHYWTDGGSPNVTAATSTLYSASQTGLTFDYYQHEASLSGLNTATAYNYDIFVNTVDATPSITDRFTTAPSSGSGAVRFIAFGDSGIGSPEQRQLATVMAADTFDVAIHSGDVVYGSSNTTGGASYKQYNEWFFDIYKDWLRSRPFFPSIGNHDNEISSARAYRDVFVLPENGASQSFPDHAERYYSFDYGPVHFVALDTELAFQNSSRRQEQLAWLEADLAATQLPWRVVYFHRSPFSSSQNHGSDLAVRQAFAPLLEQYGVQLVISGHDHDLERSVPWREYQGPQAVTYVVSGGGGAKLYPVDQSPWTAVARSAYHYVRGAVSGCQLTLEAVGLDGDVFDQHVLDRCAQASDQSPPTVSIQSPADSETVSGEVLVQAQASDDIRVEKVDLWINGALAAIDIASPYEFSWNTNAVLDGTYTLETRAYDIAGNRSSSGVINVQVANATSTGEGDIVAYASEAAVVAGNWSVVTDSTAAGGARIANPNQGAAKLSTPLANPADYFELTFDAEAGRAYRLWVRGRAQNDHFNNDSVFVQFSGSVDSTGSAVFRTGTTSATTVALEGCTGCGLSGWGWEDNGWAGFGPLIYFETTGTQTIRVQVREDGMSIDQIVLSPERFLNSAPGAQKNDTTILPKTQ